MKNYPVNLYLKHWHILNIQNHILSFNLLINYCIHYSLYFNLFHLYYFIDLKFKSMEISNFWRNHSLFHFISIHYKSLFKNIIWKDLSSIKNLTKIMLFYRFHQFLINFEMHFIKLMKKILKIKVSNIYLSNNFYFKTWKKA